MKAVSAEGTGVGTGDVEPGDCVGDVPVPGSSKSKRERVQAGPVSSTAQAKAKMAIRDKAECFLCIILGSPPSNNWTGSWVAARLCAFAFFSSSSISDIA